MTLKRCLKNKNEIKKYDSLNERKNTVLQEDTAKCMDC